MVTFLLIVLAIILIADSTTIQRLFYFGWIFLCVCFAAAEVFFKMVISELKSKFSRN